MPTIEGHFPIDPDPARMRPCVLCEQETDVLALAPGLDPPRELPLHVFCAAWLVRQFGRPMISRSGAAQIAGYLERVGRLLGGGA